MKYKFSALWITLSSLIISYGLGHGIVSAGIIQLMIFTDFSETLADIEWFLVGLFFTIGQLIILLSGLTNKPKNELILTTIGSILIILGTITLIGIGKGAILITVLTIIPFGLLTIKKIKKLWVTKPIRNAG